MGRVKRKVMYYTTKVMGPVAESIIDRQCELLGIDLDSASKDELENLAEALAKNAILMVGREKANLAKEKVLAISESFQDS